MTSPYIEKYSHLFLKLIMKPNVRGALQSHLVEYAAELRDYVFRDSEMVLYL